MKPFSPEEAKSIALTNIPDEVISIVNNLLVQNLRNGNYASFLQKEIIDEYKKLYPDNIFNIKWLDFEELYEANGWKVTYDSPAYCESFPASFKFEKK